ncbi:unnamed protein product, partial [Oppiella nova]
MAKHTTTHLFFHMNDTSSANSQNKMNSYGGGTGSQRKPTKRTTTTLNHELNNSFDYYDYFSNYGRLMSTPPLSPSHSMPRESIREREYRYVDESRRAYSGDRDHERRYWRRPGPPKY